MKGYLLAIDPGSEESAYALLDPSLHPVRFGKHLNDCFFYWISNAICDIENDSDWTAVIEDISSYGMPVGKEVFATCIFIGRLQEWFNENYDHKAVMILRKDEKRVLCHSMLAKDSNIRQALIDRFGVVGTKNKPGWFYGVHGDVWSAIAVGVTCHDLKRAGADKDDGN